ncbi:DUF3085 domain-containing protein [Sinorhizobium medicae]|uniref:DUF3085 domain-containing protein n=1 Tax=Sinorhizobium medicae TaxID=110321 RepID=UPI000C7A412A|nr:DUF3085 domain-containing protein [Sinorhizobium medicae]MDX1148064.1 DUF3085 domain-containing protein [Sinorhizobium medicae]PLU13410.1 hypothetical protein BMJ31_26735 [Sinorhizobium medicae]PLU44689.1 hypothetical protein BMJ28_03225 [Sinorhizobium medicae]PLU45048.1 hypothetical protein BMJ26_01670 [Sinorhizobium medicae]PLU47471.1 hypothetical protein BMJ24_33425 [Sinorhizobium medicae]
MLLTFPVAQLRDLLKSAEASWPKGQRALWHQDAPEPGFWLRCDYGVYLMHNANLDAGEKPVLVHALECNPETMPFSLRLDEKASYGCIDEVEFIAAEVIRNAVANDSPLLLHVTAGQYAGRMLVRIV